MHSTDLIECNTLSDVELAGRLQNKYPEHFNNLVRMHLSFALDLNLNTDESDGQNEKGKLRCGTKWGFPFPKKCRNSKGNIMEGNLLTDDVITQIETLIDFLCDIENISQEGIFRRTGSLLRQTQLKNLLSESPSVDLKQHQFSIHDCASILKNILSELPEPLATDAFYPIFCQISDLLKRKQDESDIPCAVLQSLQLVTMLLPAENLRVFKGVMRLLHFTAQHADSNKMSAENLSTIFIPHILCPKKSSGEELHTNSQILSGLVTVMIQAGPELFEIPTGLAADVRLYWIEKEKKKLSPKENFLNESTTDSCVVNTVISFVDRERTAQENTENPTEAALAQLYAHIQTLPESAKKRKLVKQFNKENGQGTPRKLLLNNNQKTQNKSRNLGESLKKHIFNKNMKYSTFEENKHVESDDNSKNARRNRTKGKLLEQAGLNCRECYTSDASSPSSNIYSPPSSNSNGNKKNSSKSTPSKRHSNANKRNHDGATNATPTCPVKSVSNLTSVAVASTNQDNKSASTVDVNKNMALTSTPAVRSNVCEADCVITPSPMFVLNDDMSPITMSTQKMPKAMQETMMTPRSRKPVFAVSGSNASQLHVSEPQRAACILNFSDSDLTNESWSRTFQDYLTASPVDLSFSSRTGDFDPSSSGSGQEKADSLSDFHSVAGETSCPVNAAGNRSNYVHETVL